MQTRSFFLASLAARPRPPRERWRRAIQAWSALSFALALSSCKGTEAATEIVIAIDSEFRAPSEIDAVVIQVKGDRGQEETRADLGSSSSLDFPLTLTVATQVPNQGAFNVNVIGYLGTTAIVRNRARLAFVPGETRMLFLELLESCKDVCCGAEQTCRQGRCSRFATSASDLPVWNGSVPPLDTPPGCMNNSFETCNRRDDDCDGMIDERIDLSADNTNCGLCGLNCGTRGQCNNGVCGTGNVDLCAEADRL